MFYFCTANNPPVITGPDSFMVRLNEESIFTISVVDANLASFTIISGDVEGGVLTESATNMSVYTFTWTVTALINSSIVFLATDELNASSQYEPQIEFCQCLNGSVCTLDGVLNQLANPVDLNCICSTGRIWWVELGREVYWRESELSRGVCDLERGVYRSKGSEGWERSEGRCDCMKRITRQR